MKTCAQCLSVDKYNLSYRSFPWICWTIFNNMPRSINIVFSRCIGSFYVDYQLDYSHMLISSNIPLWLFLFD